MEDSKFPNNHQSYLVIYLMSLEDFFSLLSTSGSEPCRPVIRGTFSLLLFVIQMKPRFNQNGGERHKENNEGTLILNTSKKSARYRRDRRLKTEEWRRKNPDKIAAYYERKRMERMRLEIFNPEAAKEKRAVKAQQRKQQRRERRQRELQVHVYVIFLQKMSC